MIIAGRADIQIERSIDYLDEFQIWDDDLDQAMDLTGYGVLAKFARRADGTGGTSLGATITDAPNGVITLHVVGGIGAGTDLFTAGGDYVWDLVLITPSPDLVREGPYIRGACSIADCVSRP